MADATVNADEAVGKRIDEAAKQKNMSQYDLAEELHMSRQNLWKIRHGRIGIKSDTVIKLYEVLGITPNELFLGYKEKEKDDVLRLFCDCDEAEREHLIRVIEFEKEEYRRIRSQ